jgi:hypothetical protein
MGLLLHEGKARDNRSSASGCALSDSNRSRRWRRRVLVDQAGGMDAVRLRWGRHPAPNARYPPVPTPSREGNVTLIWYDAGCQCSIMDESGTAVNVAETMVVAPTDDPASTSQVTLSLRLGQEYSFSG